MAVKSSTVDCVCLKRVLNIIMRIIRFTFIIPFLLFFIGCASIMADPMNRPPAELLKEARKEFKDKNFERTRELLEALKARDAEKKYYVNALILIADSYFAQGKHMEAAIEYKAFLDLHTYHKKAPYAQYMLALSYFEQIDSVDRSFENILIARREFHNLLKRYRNNRYRKSALAKIVKCNNLLAEYEDYVGSFYLKKGAYRAAIGRFEGLLKDFPESTVEVDVLLKLGRAYKEMDNTGKAGEILSLLVSRYPSSKQAARAREILDTLSLSP